MAWLSGGIPASIFKGSSSKEAAQQLHWPYGIREIHQVLQFVPKALVGSWLRQLQAIGNSGLELGRGNQGLVTDHWPYQVQDKTLKLDFQLVVFSIYFPKNNGFLKVNPFALQHNIEPRAFRSLRARFYQ